MLTWGTDQDGDGRIDRVDHRQSMRELLTKYKFGEQALIVVDLQNDFVCGSLKVEGGSLFFFSFCKVSATRYPVLTECIILPGLDAVRNTNSIRRKVATYSSSSTNPSGTDAVQRQRTAQRGTDAAVWYGSSSTCS